MKKPSVFCWNDHNALNPHLISTLCSSLRSPEKCSSRTLSQAYKNNKHSPVHRFQHQLPRVGRSSASQPPPFLSTGHSMNLIHAALEIGVSQWFTRESMCFVCLEEIWHTWRYPNQNKHNLIIYTCFMWQSKIAKNAVLVYQISYIICQIS